MGQSRKKSQYDPAEDSFMDQFTLDDILAEYGGGSRKLLDDVDRQMKGEDVPAPAAPAPEEAAVGVPPDPRPISLEEVVGNTVASLMKEEEPLMEPRRRGLFSRRKLEETEELYTNTDKEKTVLVPEVERIGPEPELAGVAARYKDAYRRGKAVLPCAVLLALLQFTVLAAEVIGYTIPYWTGNPVLQCGIQLVCLLGMAALCHQVIGKGARLLQKKRFTPEVVIALAALAAAGDCTLYLLGAAGRTEVQPYTMVVSTALAFAQWGVCRENRGKYETFRVGAMDDTPPYLVTEIEEGARKEKGAIPGFYTCAVRRNRGETWQAIVLPVVAMAALVFAVLTSFGQGRGGDFLLNLSITLSAAATFSLPLCWGLPFGRLAVHLQKTGCAVAGWDGACNISASGRMVLTDTDLFPPGTIKLNGVKVYGEELARAAAYAAAMTKAAGCGLERLFGDLARSENAGEEQVAEFSFYEEGGYSGAIHGESVWLGTASFMRKMGVRLPGDINLKTGIFLAVDRELVAVFAVKYHPAETVDFALRMLRRNNVTPILASRDPNITPALLKRKFHKRVKVEYSSLSSRVALSEPEKRGGMPRALLLREGLLPYAETVAGSRRLCSAVRGGTALSLLGSAAGTMLAYYLLGQQAYDLLSPLALEMFLLLWTVPVFLQAYRAGQY